MSVIKGTCYITDNPDIIYNTPINNNIRIISMDEDNILAPNDAIIVGTCLLPPVEAKIAEADGNERLYDDIYLNYLLEPYQQEFMSALVSFLYKGGNLLFFLPEIGYTNTMEKFIAMVYINFGIHIGLIGHKNPAVANFYLDNRCIPIWLFMVYSVRVIDAYEFLYMYPLDASLTENARIMDQLLDEIRPYADTLNKRVEYILRLHKLIHQNPRVRPVIANMRRGL